MRTSKMMTLLAKGTSILFVCLSLAACNYDNLAQNNLYPVKDANKTAVPSTPPSGFAEVMLTESNASSNANQIHSWFYDDASTTTKPVLIYLHGNGSNLGGIAAGSFLERLKSFGLAVMVLDYPSYGKSTGTPSEATNVKAAQLGLDWIQTQFPNRHVVVWGRSLGTGVATSFIAKNQDRLIGWVLTSPWYKLSELMEMHYGSMVNSVSDKWKKANTYDQALNLQNNTLPGLILHGDKDTLIPYEMGQRLFNGLTNQPVSFVTLNGREHNDVFGDETLWSSIQNFLNGLY